MADIQLNSVTLATESGGTVTVDSATSLTGVTIPAAGVTGVLPVGVTGGSGLTALGTVASGTIGPSVDGFMKHITTINLDVNPYTNSAGGTANVGGDIHVLNIFNQSAPNDYDHWVIYFDEVSHSADSEFRMKVITGTNGESGDLGSVMGYISHATPSGLTVSSATWHGGTNSGPDQDGNSHNSGYTGNAWWALKPASDVNVFGNQVVRLKSGTGGGQRKIYGYADGSHDHTDTAMGPYHSAGIYTTDLISTVVNGFFLQASGGNWNSGKIRIYGRRSD